MQNLMKNNGVEVPNDLAELINDLDQVKNLTEDANDIMNVSYDDLDQDTGSPSLGRGGMVNADSDYVHKQKILNAILKRINKQRNQIDQGIGAQSDLESLSGDESQDQRIEQIVNQKSKSIADVLLTEGLGQLYGNFFQ